MAYSEAAINEALDGITVDLISLHSGDPGAAGTANEVTGGGYARGAVTFNAASGGERLLSADETFSTPASQSVTYFGFWEAAGPTFKGSVAASGDTAANSAGEYVVKGTTTKLTLT